MSLREGAAGATEEEMADWIREGKVEKRRKRGRFERRLREERWRDQSKRLCVREAGMGTDHNWDEAKSRVEE
jgi:hypothetical protein